MMTMMQWLKPGARAITRLLLAACASSALAGPVADRVQSQSVLRVCLVGLLRPDLSPPAHAAAGRHRH